MDGLKLFVVGELSGNPAEWPVEGFRVFVLARDAAEASRLANMGDDPVAQIVADEPQVLVRECQEDASL
jgi:hypothetical protein